MFDFFDQVLGFFESIWQFFVNFLSMLWLFIDTLSRSVLLPIELVGVLPSILGSAILIVIAIAVVKLILGR